MPAAQELLSAFEAISGRARQVLVARVLERKSPEVVAAELEAALASPSRVPPPADPLPDAEERAAAWALANALDRGLEEARGPLLERRFALCKAMLAAPELKKALVVPPPPPPTLRERARRLAWLALVIAAAVLYSRWSAR